MYLWKKKRVSLLVLLLVLLGTSFIFIGCETEETLYILTMEVDGEGSVSPPIGVHKYSANSLVQIEAIPHEGWEFKEWIGDVSHSTDHNTTTLMDRDKTITALFEVEKREYFPLNVLIIGEGSVEQDPPPPDEGYREGTLVSLKAVPSAGWEFDGWMGDVEDLWDEETTVLIDEEKSIIAFFFEEKDPHQVTLTIEKEGEGALSPTLGDHIVSKDTFVEVSATPHEGWSFIGWEGDVENRELEETRIFMDSDKTIRALFEEVDEDIAQEIISEKGGTVRLPDGTRLVFPPQAVSEEVLITLSLEDPSSYVSSDLYEAVVLDIQSPVTNFSEPVEIRIPLPEGAPTEIEYFFAGFYEEEGGNIVYHDEELPLQVVEEENGYELVATTLHFSRPVFQWIREWWEGVPEKTEFTLPYYNQGATEYCWAVCLQMVTDSFVSIEEHREEIWRIISDLGISEAGVDGHTFRYSQEIEDIVRRRVGVSPERSIWYYVAAGHMDAPLTMIRYIRQELSKGRPVILFSAPKGHAFTLIGYDSLNDTYQVHDPATGPPAKTMTNEELGIKGFDGIPFYDFYITLVVPEELPLRREAVTVNIPHGATLLFRQPNTTLHQPNNYSFHWDYESMTGYSFRDLDGIPYGINYSSIPGQTREVLFGGPQGRGFEVANAWDSSVNAEMRIAITPEMHEEPIYEVTKDLFLMGHTLRSGVYPGEGTIPLKEFRLPGPEVYRYEMSIEVLEGGRLVNQKRVYFDLDPAIPYIQDLEVEWPEEEEEPVTFHIHGWNFLAEQRESRVLFHETEVLVLDWSEEIIKVEVPREVLEEEHIDVVVIVDTIESNPYPLSSTYTLTVELKGEEGEVNVTPSVGTHSYPQNSQVDLIASIDEHHDRWEFIGWEGDVEDPESMETSILMDEDKRVKAIFQGKPVYILPPRELYPPNDEEYTHTFEAIPLEEGEYVFEWDFDDGSSVVTDTGESSSVSHTYAPVGDEFIILQRYPTVKIYRGEEFLGEDSIKIVYWGKYGW